MSQLRLQKWEPKNILKNRIILVIGRRGSGKSTLLENILYEQSDMYDLVAGMCPTINTQKMLARHIPETLIYPEGNSETDLRRMIDTQKKLSARGRNNPALLIWDDCMFDTKIMKTKTMRDLAMNGRQYNITFINCMQYCLDFPPSIRSQVDYVIVLKENVRANKEKLHKYFFGMFSSVATFSNVLDKVTDNYGALVLDNTKPVQDISQQIFWYRGRLEKDIPEFKMCRDIFWDMEQDSLLESATEETSSSTESTREDPDDPGDSEDNQVITIF